MSVPKGAAEQAIRRAAEAKLREWYPGARIIHELNVDTGDVRADLAAVTNDTLVLVELKSEADTLDRLPEQVRRFGRVAHQVIICASDKFGPYYNWPGRDGWPCWTFDGQNIDVNYNRPYDGKRHPWSMLMLQLLWASELRQLCGRLSVSVGKREPRTPMINEIIRLCRAPEIEAGVCRALRERRFVAADAA